MRLTLVRAARQHLPKDYSNMPKRFVEKALDFTSWRPPRGQQFQQSAVKRWRSKPYYDIHRPWTGAFEEQNSPGVKVPDIFVEPFRDWYIYRGDRVEILRGPDKGKQGIVNMVITERNWVFVEGLNLKKEIRNKTDYYPGTLLSEERPLLVPRDVALVDPADKKPVRVEWRFDEEGNQVRVSLRTGRILPTPTNADETIDFKDSSVYPEQPKDTPAAAVASVTYKPTAKTFEMDIMERQGIKEERVPYPMYWY